MASKSPESIKHNYLLHWLVWHNDYKELENELPRQKQAIEQRDPRGRTPLMLAVVLGHLESTRVLLKHNANVNVEDADGFTVVHEAVSTGNPDIIREVLERRDIQRYGSRVGGIPELLRKIANTPDFYVEMKWEFTSWVPLVSRMCPSDTYKVYKCGSNVRIDTTLLGFDQSSWQRGSRSYVFKGHEDSAVMMEIDHEAGQVYVEQMRMVSPQMEDAAGALKPSLEAISARLTNPIVTTYVDTDKISFERNKTGIWGWRSDKTEMVNGHECKVFSANNVELVTKTRTEHLTEADKARHRSARSPLQSFLGIVEVEDKSPTTPVNGVIDEMRPCLGNPCNITPEQYFDPSYDLGNRNIGRPKEVLTKVQKFKATLWLSENYPLSLPEQIMPIVDLMAISSMHFAKLRDFITLQLPAGFPVKIEIPLFHVLNARITFGNIFAQDEPVPGVTTIKDENTSACVVDESCFEPPPGYVRLGTDEFRQLSIDDDDELLQYAIQQSLLEAGTEEDQVTIWEALKSHRPDNFPSEEDQAFQRALEESRALYQAACNPGLVHVGDDAEHMSSPLLNSPIDSQLELALKLSKQVKEEEERRQREEEEMLERVLKLSLTEQ